MTPILAAKQGRQLGFTLLELLIVISIIILAVGLIIPNIATTQSSAFNAEVRKAVATLTYSRRIAIVEATPATALFLIEDENTDTNAQLQLPEKIRNLQWRSKVLRMAYQGEFDLEPEMTTAINITFFPEGGSTGGSLYFSQDAFRAVVRVDPITGRISAAYNGEELSDDS